MSKDDYEVGYCKPPKATQFRAGRSGNPKGRPCKPRSLDALIDQALDATVQITENGIPKKLAWREVFIKSLFNRAMKGDRWASKEILKRMDNTPETLSFETELEDLAVLEKFKARFAGGPKG